MASSRTPVAEYLTARELLPQVSADPHVSVCGEEDYEELLDCSTSAFVGSESRAGGLLTAWVYGRPSTPEEWENLRVAVRATMQKYVRSYLWFGSVIAYRESAEPGLGPDSKGKMLGFVLLAPPGMTVDGVVQFTPAQKERIAKFCGPGHPSEDKARYGEFVAVRGGMLDCICLDLHKKYATEDHWYLHFLGVKPECQGQGVGSKLIQAVIQIARLHAMPVYLECHEAKVEYYKKYLDEKGSLEMEDPETSSTKGPLRVHAFFSK